MKTSDLLSKLAHEKKYDYYADQRSEELSHFISNSPLGHFDRLTKDIFEHGNREDIDQAISDFLRGDLSWVRLFFERWIDALRSDPACLPPIRQTLESNDSPFSDITIFQNNSVAISVQSICPHELQTSRSREGHVNVIFSGQVAHFAVVSGGPIQARLWTSSGFDDGSDLRAVRCTGSSPIVLESGQTYPVDGSTHSLSFESVDGPAVVLMAVNRMREIGSAVITHSASGDYVASHPADRSATRRMFLSSALRHLQVDDRREALEAGISNGPFYQRWHVMREMIVADEETARAPLAAMAANDPNPLVRDAANATIDILNETGEEDAHHA